MYNAFLLIVNKLSEYRIYTLVFVCVGVTLLCGCEKYDRTPPPFQNPNQNQIPTKTRMEGVWIVRSVIDTSGYEYICEFQDTITPITAFYFASDNTVVSTAGPLTIYLVYGYSMWTSVSSTIDQVFNYSNLNYNGGEYCIASGVANKFTLEMKLEGVGGAYTLEEILSTFGIQAQWLDMVVYHRFYDVAVDFNEAGDTMCWNFNCSTYAEYNKKDQYGNFILWDGWPNSTFSRCKIVLVKDTRTLNDIVTEAYSVKNNN